MMNPEKTLIDFTIKLLNDYREEGLVDKSFSINESTTLYGIGGCLNSLSLVTMIVDLEEFITNTWGQEIVIADSKVFSQSVSPFRSVQSLAGYILTILKPAA